MWHLIRVSTVFSPSCIRTKSYSEEWIVTIVELDLCTWQIDECPVISYSIKFHSWDETESVEVMYSINWNTVGLFVSFYPYQPSFFVTRYR